MKRIMYKEKLNQWKMERKFYLKQKKNKENIEYDQMIKEVKDEIIMKIDELKASDDYISFNHPQCHRYKIALEQLGYKHQEDYTARSSLGKCKIYFILNN